MVERRPILRHDRMVCFDDGADRFQMRAAAIAIRNGRVLVQNIKGESTVFLPGGRIEQGEESGETLVREMQEEFGHTVEVGDLVFVMESFYPSRAQLFHEVSLYYRIAVGDDFPPRHRHLPPLLRRHGRDGVSLGAGHRGGARCSTVPPQRPAKLARQPAGHHCAPRHARG
jgi:8-oxo-dGTP pyrophosphatase MutT (NUDIX family)